MKAKDYLRRQFNKDEDYKCKRYGKKVVGGGWKRNGEQSITE